MKLYVSADLLNGHAPAAQQQLHLMLSGVAANMFSARVLRD